MNLLRNKLFKVFNIESSYFYTKGIKKNKRIDVSKFKEGAYVTKDMRNALYKLKKIVEENKGNLYITELYRSWETQDKARKDYELGIKKHYVAKPGGSFHNAGRAVDFDTQNLNFEGIKKEHWLQKFWDLAKPLGFKPIIKIPSLNISENWHFDRLGEWSLAYKKLPYSEIAKCCILDIGKWKDHNKIKIRNMFIQAQLIRLEFFEIGKVDGIIGPKTEKILKILGLNDFHEDIIAEKLKDY
jgi:hypothetical protein